MSLVALLPLNHIIVPVEVRIMIDKKDEVQNTWSKPNDFKLSFPLIKIVDISKSTIELYESLAKEIMNA